MSVHTLTNYIGYTSLYRVAGKPGEEYNQMCLLFFPAMPKQNLKKLNWKRQVINQPTIARAGGTVIWKELPKVEVPHEAFSHLFAQRTLDIPMKAVDSTVSTALQHMCTYCGCDACATESVHTSNLKLMAKSNQSTKMK